MFIYYESISRGNDIIDKDIYVIGWMCTNNRIEGPIKRYMIFEDHNGKKYYKTTSDIVELI